MDGSTVSIRTHKLQGFEKFSGKLYSNGRQYSGVILYVRQYSGVFLYVPNSDYALRTYFKDCTAPHPGAEKRGLINVGEGNIEISFTRLRWQFTYSDIQH
jgi:hypothetical protein